VEASEGETAGRNLIRTPWTDGNKPTGIALGKRKERRRNKPVGRARGGECLRAGGAGGGGVRGLSADVGRQEAAEPAASRGSSPSRAIDGGGG
jgi:hypothetical protein